MSDTGLTFEETAELIRGAVKDTPLDSEIYTLAFQALTGLTTGQFGSLDGKATPALGLANAGLRWQGFSPITFNALSGKKADDEIDQDEQAQLVAAHNYLKAVGVALPVVGQLAAGWSKEPGWDGIHKTVKQVNNQGLPEAAIPLRLIASLAGR